MSGEKKQSKASRAIDLAVASGAELWHDPDGEPYADVLGEHGERRTLRVRSRAFRTWLAGLMYSAEAAALGGQSATDAVDVLAAIAVYDGDERSVYVRLAPGPHEDLFLDLGDDSWQAIRISPDGWEVVSDPPVRFRRSRGLRPLPEPQRGAGGWDALQKQLNLQGRHWTLTVAWLVGTLHPRCPYPILALTGEQGSAKTTIGRQVRSIVDPSEAPLWSPPRKDRELVIAARNSHVLGLDNLSRIPDWLSDALCRIATGGGYSARELYSDGDEVVYSDRRPIIVTSIETVVTRGDLADRALAVTLPRIPEESRLPERVIYERMDRIQPLVLGALLDAVVTGLRRLPSVKLERLPRMADFAEWIVACEPALPWKGGAFLDAYSEARDEMVEIGIEADTVAVALTEFLRADGKWSGRAGELLEALNAKRTDGNRPPRGWPETPQAMGGRLTRAAPLLRASGWDVERGEGRDRYTIYLTPNQHGRATGAHDTHTRSHASDGADPDRERTGEQVGNVERIGPTPAHANSPTATRDVSTREHGEHDLGNGTSSGPDPAEELDEEDRQYHAPPRCGRSRL